MTLTKVTLWYGKNISFEELWCDFLHQEWSEEMDDIWRDYDHTVLSCIEGDNTYFLELKDVITNTEKWFTSIQKLSKAGLEVCRIPHDQLDDGYARHEFIIGYSYNKPVKLEDLPGRYAGNTSEYKVYAIQDDCKCCS